MVGGFGALPGLVESTHRMVEYNVFTIPRVIEGLWDLLTKLKIVNNIPYGDKLIFAVSMAMLINMKRYIK